MADTLKIEFFAWDGSGIIMLEIDHGSDGTFEEIVYLDNQMRVIYLPVVRLK